MEDKRTANTSHKARNKRTTTPIPRAALSVEEAATALGIGRTYVFELIKDGTLETVKLGRRRLVPMKAVDALLARMKKL